MIIELPIQPKEEARLIALARSKGLSTEALLRVVIDKILGEVSETGPKKPTRSLRGLLAKYGTAPSTEEIDQNRAEMFASFPRDDKPARLPSR
jgi:hypothetical protein